MIPQNFHDTLTAQLITEYIVSHGLIVPADIKQSVLEFQELFNAVQAELTPSDRSFMYAQILIGRSYDAGQILEIIDAVEEATGKRLWGFDDTATLEHANAKMPEYNIFAISHGLDTYIHYLNGTRVMSAPIPAAVAERLVTEEYTNVPPGFTPPSPLKLEANPAYEALIQQIDDNLCVHVLRWLRDEGVLTATPSGEEQIIQDLKALFGNYMDPANRERSKRHERYRITIEPQTTHTVFRFLVVSGFEEHTFGFNVGSASGKIDALWWDMGFAALGKTEAEFRENLETVRPIVERIRQEEDLLQMLRDIFGEFTDPANRAAWKGQEEYTIQVDAVQPPSYFIFRVRTGTTRYSMTVNVDGAGNVWHVTTATGNHPSAVATDSQILAMLDLMRPIVERIRAGTGQPPAQPPAGDLWRAHAFLEEIYAPFLHLTAGDKATGMSRVPKRSSKPGNDFTIREIHHAVNRTGEAKHYEFDVLVKKRTRKWRYTFRVAYSETNTPVRFTVVWGGNSASYETFADVIRYLSQFEPAAKAVAGN